MDEMAQITFLCECGACSEYSHLTFEEWVNADTLRDQLPGFNFIVNPGHVNDGDVVVEKHEKYWIVK